MKTPTFRTKIPRLECGAALAAICLLSLAGPTQSTAASRTWTGGGSPDFNWSNPANWGGTAPGAGDSLFFDGTTGLQNTNDLAAGTSFTSITFNAGAGAFVIQGNLAKIGAQSLGTGTGNGTGGVTNSSPNLQTFYIQLESDRTVHYDTTGADIINLNKLWDWRWYKHGANKLIIANTNTASGLNGQILGIDGGVVVFNSQPGAGVIGNGLKIDAGGTLQIVGPSTDQISSSRDIFMTGGRVQIQTTNAAGAPAFEEVASLKSLDTPTNAIVENGSALGPVLLDLGGGNSRRGAYTGIIQDGGPAPLAIRVKGGTWERFGGSNSYSGTTVVTNITVSGITRLIVDGTHVGGGEYQVSGNPANPAQQAALCGSGIISASAIDLMSNSFIAPGGALSAIATNADNNTATFSETTAILTVSNAVNLTTNTASLDMHLAGTTPGPGYDQLVIAGSGTFSNNGGNLQLTVDLGFTPSGGDKFTIVKVPGTSAANNIGVFSTLNGVPTDLSQGATFNVGASVFKISYRAEGTTFDAGAGNGNDIMIQAQVSGAANLTWRGDVSGDWDVVTTPNWRNPSNTSTTFTNLDNATFDDSGLTTNINLTTALNPGNVTVNAAKDYFFSGPGKLTGGILITKTNSGRLIITTDNDNAGSVVINKGTVQIGDNGSSGALTCSLVVNSNGVLAFNRADDEYFNPTSFTGTGKFVHNGSGTLIIATNDYSLFFTGITTNSGGTLQFGDGSAAGASARIGGIIYLTGSTVDYNFGGGTAQTLGSSLSGSGAAIYEFASGASTVLFGSSATNTGFTGTTTVRAFTRVEVSAAASTPAGPIIVEDNGSGGFGAYYTHVTGLTNLNAITISGQGPGGANGPIDSPRGKGALRLGNTWSGPITLSGNATIGASAGTGAVLGNISDSGSGYNVEYFGGTIQVGPATGVNSYGITHITEDLIGSAALSGNTTVVALNSNPFGNGAVEIVGQSVLRLNGNNVSVANLIDQSPSLGVSNIPPVIQNGSTNLAATLTVGADGNAATFGGIFADGGTQPLGLAKTGSGAFTVSGDNTNTGAITVNNGTLALAASTAFYPNGSPVIGSGSFSNAATITIGSGAILDVMGRGDQTLTLNSGQTLNGNGTLNGNLVTAVGSTVAPGNSIGTLAVQGNITLGGNVLMELNRTNTPNNSDRLTASGTITASGTLSVTNIGPALHAGDFFQLFTGGVSGFTTVNLPTFDPVNNINYTWTNSVGSNGRIAVLTASPVVNTTPTNLVASVSAGALTLSWPADHTGWTLQTQTNALGAGLKTNWVAVAGSSATNQMTFSISTTNGAVFFRLVYP
jgi:autotransporter-associated beta strand protein